MEVAGKIVKKRLAGYFKNRKELETVFDLVLQLLKATSYPLWKAAMIAPMIVPERNNKETDCLGEEDSESGDW